MPIVFFIGSKDCRGIFRQRLSNILLVEYSKRGIKNNFTARPRFVLVSSPSLLPPSCSSFRLIAFAFFRSNYNWTTPLLPDPNTQHLQTEFCQRLPRPRESFDKHLFGDSPSPHCLFPSPTKAPQNPIITSCKRICPSPSKASEIRLKTFVYGISGKRKPLIFPRIMNSAGGHNSSQTHPGIFKHNILLDDSVPLLGP